MKRKLVDMEHQSQQHQDHIEESQPRAIKKAYRSQSHTLTDIMQIETAFKQLSIQENGLHWGLGSTCTEAELVPHTHSEEVSQMPFGASAESYGASAES